MTILSYVISALVAVTVNIMLRTINIHLIKTPIDLVTCLYVHIFTKIKLLNKFK